MISREVRVSVPVAYALALLLMMAALAGISVDALTDHDWAAPAGSSPRSPRAGWRSRSGCTTGWRT